MHREYRYILGVDPSGNWHEGRGITGFALYDSEEDKILWVDDLKAKDFPTDVAYWYEHFKYIKAKAAEYEDLLVSIEDYILYSGARQVAQTWSHLETPQLIGFLKVVLWFANIPYVFRTASVAKRMYPEEKLVRLGYISSKLRGKSTWYFLGDKPLLTHHRDAIKHAIKGKSEEDFAICQL